MATDFPESHSDEKLLGDLAEAFHPPPIEPPLERIAALRQAVEAKAAAPAPAGPFGRIAAWARRLRKAGAAAAVVGGVVVGGTGVAFAATGSVPQPVRATFHDLGIRVLQGSSHRDEFRGAPAPHQPAVPPAVTTATDRLPVTRPSAKSPQASPAPPSANVQAFTAPPGTVQGGHRLGHADRWSPAAVRHRGTYTAPSSTWTAPDGRRATSGGATPPNSPYSGGPGPTPSTSTAHTATTAPTSTSTTTTPTTAPTWPGGHDSWPWGPGPGTTATTAAPATTTTTQAPVAHAASTRYSPGSWSTLRGGWFYDPGA